MSRILGIDEVGRGPWAGPLVVGACVLAEEIPGLADSKQLTRRRREELAREIREKAAWSLGWVAAGELDELGLSAALARATIEAVTKIECEYSEIVIDGTVNFLAGTLEGRCATTLAKADALVPAVSAASIVAKVARDNYMAEVAEKYPQFGFEKHVGYGTKMHRQAILQFGICSEHRRSFRPIAELVNAYALSGPGRKNTTRVGERAEEMVVEYLERLGHKVVERNFRTRWCEIDIVSTFAGKIFFTEVKYRKDEARGTGLEVVGAEKLRRMRFGAESYLKYSGVKLPPLLAVAWVGGEDFEVRDWLVLR